jgi:hypothetical protein
MQTRACLIVELNAPVNFLTKKKKLLTKTFLSDNSFFRLLLDAAKIMISVKLNWFFWGGGINMRSSQPVSSFLRSFVFWLLCATQVLIRWASHHLVSWKKKEKHTDSLAVCWSRQTHRQRRNTQTILLKSRDSPTEKKRHNNAQIKLLHIVVHCNLSHSPPFFNAIFVQLSYNRWRGIY